MESMMKKAATALFAIFLLAPAAIVKAAPAPEHKGNPTGGKFAVKHPRRNEVNKRVKNQRSRVNKDEKSGKLSKAQGAQLKANDRAIKRQEHADVKANGGHITKGEQKQINREENANSKLIHDEAHPAGR